MNKTLHALATVALLAAGCASTTPTRELSASYAIYDIQAGPEIGPTRIVEALKTALQRNTSQVQITQGIPPSPLPAKAPRFQLISPLKGSGLGALAAAAGQSIQVPVCEGAIVTANARDSSMARYGEGTTFFACVMPYQGGYALNVYVTFVKTSGAINPAVLGATIARAVVGDSSQFIPRTMTSIVSGMEAAGAAVKLVEAYP